MTLLEKMPPEHFDAFAAAGSAAYAADNVASGRWLAHESEQLARAELSRLLPLGAATAGQHFYEIKLVPEGPVLGFVWFASMPRGSVEVAHVFQLFVYPPYRRQGHGRAALVLVEELAAALGLAGITLNVFGSNVGAQALYRSLGYVVTSLSMHKGLSSRVTGRRGQAPDQERR